jgi:hypothetical protein
LDDDYSGLSHTVLFNKKEEKVNGCNMRKSIILAFNGLFTVIMGEGIITRQIMESMSEFNRWFCGIAMVCFGIAGIYFSGLFQKAFSKKENKKTDDGK